MTEDEAIDIIKKECYLMPFMDYDSYIRVNTALDMAIDTLRAVKELKEMIKTYEN